MLVPIRLDGVNAVEVGGVVDLPAKGRELREGTVVAHSAHGGHAPKAHGEDVGPTNDEIPVLDVAKRHGVDGLQALELATGGTRAGVLAVRERVRLHDVDLLGNRLLARSLLVDLDNLGDALVVLHACLLGSSLVGENIA